MTELVEKVMWRPRWAVWTAWAGIAGAVGACGWMVAYAQSFESWVVLGYIISLPIWVSAGTGLFVLAAFLRLGGQGKFAGGWVLVALGVLAGLTLTGVLN